MENRTKLIALCVVSLFVAGSANAAPTIDQDQPLDTWPMAAIYQTGLAQSFQQAAGNVAGAGIFLSAWSTSGSVATISLWDNLPNAGGTQLASGSGVGSAGNWVDVFWSPVAVVPNTTLYLVFTSPDGNVVLGGDTSNPYPRGMAFADIGYGAFPTYDYAFRTYSDDTFVAAVPAPGALLLGSLGAGLIGCLRRRASL